MMRPVALLVVFLLAGCARIVPSSQLPGIEQSTSVPAVETVAPAMQRAIDKMLEHGYAAEFVPPEGSYTVIEMPEDGRVSGTRCFFLDRVAPPGIVALAETGGIDGRKCVQGYTPPFGLEVYILSGAPPDHELLHLLFRLNYPSLACPDRIGMQSAWIEHGGPCDPFQLRGER